MDACQPRGVTYACESNVNELNGLTETIYIVCLRYPYTYTVW